MTGIRAVFFAVALIASARGPTALGSVISINASKDNTLYEDASGSLSNGAGQRFFAGRAGSGVIRRGLIAFDIAASIPAGATINSASLRLNMSNTSAGATAVELHRALQNWGEGTSVAGGGEGGGAPSTPGDATWIHSFYDTTFWANTGADFAAAASATQSIGAVGVYTWNGSQLGADVQTWLNSPGSNFGWVIIGDESFAGSAKRFDSRENSVAANRPLLTIDYTPIPEPAPFMMLILPALLRRRSSRL